MKARSPYYVTALVSSAMFMENLDGTVLATALPQMAHSFAVAPVSLNVGITAYMLTLAVFIPVSGWIADRFGARSVFASAITIFTLASLLCAFSRSLTEFTMMRILQGLGGAMMVPVGRLIVLRSTPKDRMTQAITYMTWPALAAFVLGPAVGGFITTYANWRWIFLLNIPLGVIALALALAWIENTRVEVPSTRRQAFDLTTFLLAGFASSGVMYAMERLGAADSQSHKVMGWRSSVLIFLLSIMSGVLALALARRRRNSSIIDFESLSLRSYALCVRSASALRMAISAVPFLLPLMFQTCFGLSAFHSGLYLLALFAGDFAMKALVVPILHRFGFRRILVANGWLTVCSIAACAVLTPTTPLSILIAILCIHGATRSLAFSAVGVLAYSEIPPQRMSSATSFLSAVMQLSLALGVAVGAICLRGFAWLNGHSGSTPGLGDFHAAFLLLALFAGAPAIESLHLPANAGIVPPKQNAPDMIRTPLAE